MITGKQVSAVLEALGDAYLIDTVRGYNTRDGEFVLGFNDLATFLIHPPQEFVDRITGYVNTSGAGI